MYGLPSQAMESARTRKITNLSMLKELVRDLTLAQESYVGPQRSEAASCRYSSSRPTNGRPRWLKRRKMLLVGRWCMIAAAKKSRDRLRVAGESLRAGSRCAGYCRCWREFESAVDAKAHSKMLDKLAASLKVNPYVLKQRRWPDPA